MTSSLNPIKIGRILKKTRKTRGFSIVQLSEISGVNKNTICKVEKGDRLASLDTIDKMTNALNISFQDVLLDKPIENIDYVVCKRNYKKSNRIERKVVAKESTYDIGDLELNLAGGKILAGIIHVYSDGEKEVAYHAGEEFFFCLTGKIAVNISGEDIILHKGDCVVFEGMVPHSYISVGEDIESNGAVGLSVIVESGHYTLKEFYDNLKKV